MHPAGPSSNNRASRGIERLLLVDGSQFDPCRAHHPFPTNRQSPYPDRKLRLCGKVWLMVAPVSVSALAAPKNRAVFSALSLGDKFPFVEATVLGRTERPPVGA